MAPFGNQTHSDLITGFPNSNKSWLALLIFINSLAFFGNATMITGILTTKRFRNPSHYFLVSLCMSDLLCSVLVMPFGIETAVSGTWENGEATCYFWLIVDMMCCSSSVLNLALISLDKYLSIINPLRYAEFQTPRNALLMIAFVWLESMITASVPLFGFWQMKNHSEVHVCVFSWFFPPKYYIFVLSVNLLLPFVAMLYVYGRIYVTARRQLHRISILFVTQNQSNMATKIIKQNKASRKLGMLLGVFVICWSPYLTLTFYLQFCTLCRIHPFVVDIVTWLAWSNSSYNPILYSWFNREYRQMYWRMFGCANRNQIRLATSGARTERNANTVNASAVDAR
ncbi:octopamine receptor-like [Dendronephthya gigantea]|uniref:octopamine receptor-like n=1 Tax=Dendronephthya gigantea TaxID=151771 RepID=UPI00106BCA20|nr:octopamine receptor-like [Dendronephthya gigantea]